jgi:hypothetical protein
MIRHIVLESGGSCRYFVVDNHKFYFLINHKFYFVVLISFPQNMEFCCNSNEFFSSKTKKYKLL